ncbi:MAG TPA: potassium transporter TrkG [Candidatus Acidoferrum sp.]|nr:potassium transporter TrkG [Candidatus Acidoferrum sp.]
MLHIQTAAKKRRWLRLLPTQYVLIGFAAIILAGAILLTLPVSSLSGEATDFLTALFTATSATCVTGLVVVDTYTYWSTFGQWVILLLIQLGGLGFMSFATLLSLLLHRTISFSERLVMKEAMSFFDTAGIVRTTRHILFGTLFFEGTGAVILSIRFAKDFGVLGGIRRGIFHAVSAFCNAGFDIMGSYGQYSNLTHYAEDVVVNLVVMGLIVIGGLGFFVWEDIARRRTLNLKKLSLYSRLVLTMTALLISGGAVFFLFFEWDNPGTLGPLEPSMRLMAAAFQSVTCRTAGFNTIDQSALMPASAMLSMLLMFIGGASGSTAGGIKVGTFAVLMLTALSVARGRHSVTVYERSVTIGTVLRAVTIFLIAFGLTVGGGMLLTASQHVGMQEALFECFSAFGTVGLTMGLTPMLSEASRVYIILLMFFGRVGILTVTISLTARMRSDIEAVHYPETRIMIG